MTPSPPRLVALLSGPDQRGLVARVSGWIYDQGGNIVHADQHRDAEAGIFFQRVEWLAENGADASAQADAFCAFADALGMAARVAQIGHRPKVALFVSKASHCFHDLVLRWLAGEFPCEIRLVVSNHPDLGADAARYGLPFRHVPVPAGGKADAENRQLELLERGDIDLVVLARYMQILSGDFLERFGNPVVNIHHSFLPAFAGAKPYHQAYRKGVKIIGATAHYVTPELDQGPIIHQDVARVSHRHTVADLIRKGRDLEKMTLSRAVAWHLENRILVYENKTVVFD